MKYVIALIIILTASPVYAWSEADTRRQTAYFILHAADWGQTLHIAESDEFYEHNPILGRNPDRGEVNRYFLLTGLAHYGISRALPPRCRRWWQRVTIGIEAGVVAHNASIGVEVRF